jgi:5-methylcytosine-specific restriction endonuclease McrA
MLTKECKQCGSIYSSLRKECPECKKRYMREWRERNREHTIAYNREHYESQRQWMQDHPDRVIDYNRRYNEKVNGTPQREYELRNKEVQAARRSSWKKKNFMKVREYSRRRDSWMSGADPIDYAAILDRDGWICHLCGGDILSKEELHFDHVIPLSRGGKHAIDNIRPAHARCNWGKNDRLPGEAKARRKR